MNLLNPFTGKRSTARLRRGGETIELIIASQGAKANAVFLLVTLLGWVYGGYHVGRVLYNSVTERSLFSPGLFFPADKFGSFDTFFLLFWFVFWLVFGYRILSRFLWQVGGAEVIRFESDELAIGRQTFGLGVPVRYDASEVSNLRVASIEDRKPQPGARKIGGPMAFDYMHKTITCGDGLSNDDVDEVLTVIRRYYPQYFSTES